jgi:hypothetical protein
MVVPYIVIAVGAYGVYYLVQAKRLQMQEILTHKHFVNTHTHREDGSMLWHGSTDNHARTDVAMTNNAQPHKYLYSREAPSYLSQTRFSSEFVTADDSAPGIGGWY